MAYSILNKDINLLPKHKIEENNSKKSYNILLLSLLGGIIVLVFVGLFSIRSYYGLIDKKVDLVADIKKLNETESRMKELESIVIAIEAREQYQNNIDKANTSMIKLLDFLEKENANGVYVSALSDSVNDNGGKQITIKGFAINKEVIADFQDKLNETELFSSVFMPTLNEASKINSTSIFGESAPNIPLMVFSINCVLK